MNSKPEQVLVIEPQSELKFKGPFNVPITSYMKLTNPSDKKVLFKIKTTAPKKYCVRPNSGLLEPKNSIEIAICLQPFIFDPTEKNKHKFMVQTVFAPELPPDSNLDGFWKDLSPDQLMDSKLKCVFELPAEAVTNAISQENDATVIVEDKVKRDVKSSPKISSGLTPGQDVQLELQKAAQEIKTLLEEASSLRHENVQLKEEVLRLRHAMPGLNQAPVTTKYNPTAPVNQFPLIYLAGAVFIAIFGIIMGKFIL